MYTHGLISVTRIGTWATLQLHEVLVAQDFGILTCPPNAVECDYYVIDFCVLLR